MVERWTDRVKHSQEQRTNQPMRLYYTEHGELNATPTSDTTLGRNEVMQSRTALDNRGDLSKI